MDRRSGTYEFMFLQGPSKLEIDIQFRPCDGGMTMVMYCMSKLLHLTDPFLPRRTKHGLTSKIFSLWTRVCRLLGIHLRIQKYYSMII